MLSGTPTILLLNTKNFTFHPKIKKILIDLKRAKLLFFDPVDAAKHVNKIIKDPYSWYYSTQVEKIRKKYLNFSTKIDY